MSPKPRKHPLDETLTLDSIGASSDEREQYDGDVEKIIAARTEEKAKLLAQQAPEPEVVTVTATADESTLLKSLQAAEIEATTAAIEDVRAEIAKIVAPILERGKSVQTKYGILRTKHLNAISEFARLSIPATTRRISDLVPPGVWIETESWSPTRKSMVKRKVYSVGSSPRAKVVAFLDLARRIAGVVSGPEEHQRPGILSHPTENWSRYDLTPALDTLRGYMSGPLATTNVIASPRFRKEVEHAKHHLAQAERQVKSAEELIDTFTRMRGEVASLLAAAEPLDVEPTVPRERLADLQRPPVTHGGSSAVDFDVREHPSTWLPEQPDDVRKIGAGDGIAVGKPVEHGFGRQGRTGR